MGLNARALAMRDAWMRMMTLFFEAGDQSRRKSARLYPPPLCKSPSHKNNPTCPMHYCNRSLLCRVAD